MTEVMSGWKIDDIELPMGPTEDLREIERSFEEDSLFQFFPELSKSKSSGRDYSITGLLWPLTKVAELDELASNPDTTTVTLTIPLAERMFSPGNYVIKSLSLNRKGALFVMYNGIPEQVVPFVLTLTEQPKEGENQDSTDGIVEEDENSVAMRDLNNFAKSLGGQTGEIGPVEIFNAIFGLPLGI